MTDVLLERETALATLRDATGEIREGSGRIVLITGEAGQGKSALLRHFVADVPSGILVLHSGCDPLTMPSPLSPLHEVARRLGLTDDDFTRTDRSRLFASVLELLGVNSRWSTRRRRRCGRLAVQP